jgi:hypothetical protein
VSALVSSIKEAYVTIDRRVLGCFRVGYGCLLLYDLLRRAPELTLLYSNDGILTNHFLLFAPQVPYQFSIYTAFSTPAEVAVAFGLTGVIYLAYTLGLYTRLAQILALVCLTSLNQRNLMFEDGGMSVTIALGVWTLFLPLGDFYSIDALRREARVRGIVARVALRQARRVPVHSLAVTAIILQIVAIYWLNVVHKTGVTWREGSAVHYVLWQNRVNTSIGNWLAYHEPGWFSPLTTWGTIVAEAAIPLLVLSPWLRTYARTLAFLFALGLHGGIALVMTLGPFSYAMLALVSLMIPALTLQRLAGLIPRHVRLRGYRLRARALRFLAAFPHAPPAPRPSSDAARTWQRALFGLREWAIALVIVINVVETSVDNHAIRRFIKLPQPQAFASFTGYLRMIQSWNMFAPDAPIDDGMTVVDAETESGRHIDPFTGKAPDFELGVYQPVPHRLQVCDYLFAMRVGYQGYRDQLAQYLSRWHTLHKRPYGDRIISYKVWWASHRSPKPGSTTPFEFKRELIFTGP